MPKLTKSERRFFNEYQKCFNATIAVQKVLNPSNLVSAASMGYQLKKSVFSKLQITEDDLMERMGLTEERLIQKLNDKLDAKDKVVVRDKNGVKAIEVDNHAVQLKAAELALKLRGKLSNKLEVTGENGEPIKMQVLAGVAFIPRDDRNISDTKPEGDAQVAEGGFIPRFAEIQDSDLAQTSQEDNNSNK